MAFTASMRFTGINSGFDTEMMVSNMMKAENMKLSKLQKTLMLDTYRQEQYRTLSTDMKTFQKDFLNIMTAGSIRSAGTFGGSMSVKDADGKASTAVSIGVDSAKGEHTIDVKQLAAADLYESAGNAISSRSGFRFDVSSIKSGTSFDFTLDGAKKRITFTEGDQLRGIEGLEDGVLTFQDGKVSLRYRELDESIGENGMMVTKTKELTEADFMKIFNAKLGDAFGGDAGTGKQKIEAKLTESGGVSFKTNGSHTGFTVANGNYSFANVTGKEMNLSKRDEIGLRLTSLSDRVEIKVDINGKTTAQAVDELNRKISEAGFGDKVIAELRDGQINFTNYSTTEAVTISDSMEGLGSLKDLGFAEGAFTLGAGGGLSALGIDSGAPGKINVGDTLADVYGSDLTDETTFTINGTRFVFTGGSKISEIIDAVNNAKIGVNMSYDSYQGSFKLEASETGVVNKITMSGELLTQNFGFGDTATRAAADAVAVIDGVTLTRADNSFTHEGVDWTLNKVTDGELTASTSSDTDKIIESIKGFIDGYNALIEKMRAQTGTMRPKSQGSYFDPLTDEERAEMSESDIKLWDEKAKTGLLYNDSIIENIESQLRAALNSSVTMADGSKLSLASLGITTTMDWSKGGALEIRDETKLREAIEKYGDKLGDLFGSTEEGNKGLAERVNDVLTNATSATGPIAKKAGIAGTYTETNNEIFRRLTAQNDAIEKLMEQLAVKEENYYVKFGKIEAAMSQANSQMQYVQSMFG